MPVQLRMWCKTDWEVIEAENITTKNLKTRLGKSFSSRCGINQEEVEGGMEKLLVLPMMVRPEGTAQHSSLLMGGRGMWEIRWEQGRVKRWCCLLEWASRQC